MKRFAIIGIAILGLTLVFAVSPASARTGMTKAEYRALMLRSEALNRLYQAPGKPAQMSLPEYRALMLRSEGLNQKYGVLQVRGENYFANGLPNSTPSVASTSTDDFEWVNVSIGFAGLLGLVVIVAGAIGLRRHRLQIGTS